jgi:hypothetical protein
MPLASTAMPQQIHFCHVAPMNHKRNTYVLLSQRGRRGGEKKVGGLAQDLSNFQLAPIPILSVPTCSTSSPHDILKVSKKKNTHNPPVGRVERVIDDPGGFTSSFFAGFWLGLILNVPLCCCCFWNFSHDTYCHQYTHPIVYYTSLIVIKHDINDTRCHGLGTGTLEMEGTKLHVGIGT